MAVGSTQTLTEMSTRNLREGKGWLAREAENLENVGASTSHNPMGLHGLLHIALLFYYLLYIYVFAS
jgi:hypothetical protein